jgi:hypothetical protein
MTATREAMVRCLLHDDIKNRGLGDETQRTAWEEIEWRRCGRDFEYWRVNYTYIVLKSGDIIPWTDPYPMQVEAIQEWMSGASTQEGKARQLGQTTNGTHYALHDCMWGQGVVWNFFGADDDASKDMKTRLDATLDRLPEWMLNRARRTPGSNSTEDIRRKNKQDGATIITFGLSKIRVFSGAVKKAQGLTGKTLWDDAGKHTDPERKWQLLYPTIDDPDPNNRGQVIIIFNGNGEDFLFFLSRKAKAGEVSLKWHFRSWKDDPRRVWMVDDEGIGPHCVIENRKEVYPWYVNAERQYLIQNPEADIYSFKAQYPSTEEEMFYVTGNSYFDLTMINGMSRLAKTPINGVLQSAGEDEHFRPQFNFIRQHSGRYQQFLEPLPNARYVIGVDTADARSPKGDYSVAWCAEYLMDTKEIDRRAEEYGWLHPPVLEGKPAFTYERGVDALDTACVFRARLSPVSFAYEVELLARYYNDAFVVIESNPIGGTLISHLKETYNNLYKQVKVDTKFTDDRGENIGYWSNERSKLQLLSELNHRLATGGFFMRDPLTIGEYSKFGYDDKGKPTAPKGLTDDRVIASGLCCIGANDLRFAPTEGAEVNYGWDW